MTASGTCPAGVYYVQILHTTQGGSPTAPLIGQNSVSVSGVTSSEVINAYIGIVKIYNENDSSCSFTATASYSESSGYTTAIFVFKLS